MDMLHQSNCVFPIDIVQHNQTLKIYKQFFLPPLRNVLCFTNIYDKTIIIHQIEEKINFLCSIGFKFDKLCEIKYTDFSWYLKYDGIIDDNNIIDILLKDHTLKYLSINGVLHKFEHMIDIIYDKKVLYNPCSFRQNDISIKNTIYNILKDKVTCKNLYLIGGDMVFYVHLLDPINFIMYSDFQSIYDDAQLNFPKNKEIYLINYDKDRLKKTDKSYCLIANTSKHGLGDNLCKEILDLDLNEIIIISCNKKSFL